MSIIETLSDVNNTFLSRREITCNFAGLSGRLKKLEAVDMIKNELNLGDKVIIPMRIQNHSGKSVTTGTFFVYDDEVLAKKHVNPTIFSRLEKAKAKQAESEKAQQSSSEDVGSDATEAAGEKPPKEAGGEETPTEQVKEEKSE